MTLLHIEALKETHLFGGCPFFRSLHQVAILHMNGKEGRLLYGRNAKECIHRVEVTSRYIDLPYGLRGAVTWGSHSGQAFASEEPMVVGIKTESAGCRPVFLSIRNSWERERGLLRGFKETNWKATGYFGGTPGIENLGQAVRLREDLQSGFFFLGKATGQRKIGTGEF
ncbi:hypothetical protein TNCV_154861 [Trichonephila clavipes]|uniref:Uncharacterized protein n=1 Tax=Trichonephila clavipes TaxID=2585209 RepID=A0A8X6WH08_TRICX|nr:hypothetical protein TNCV_154861 [Trichonephila clavipes]